MPWGLCIWLTAVILWVTQAPFLPRMEPWQPVLSPPTRLAEVVGNLLLMAPLAFLAGRCAAARWRGRRPVVLLGLALLGACVLVEGGQVFIEERLVTPYDLALNLVGGSLGLWLGVETARRGPRGRRWSRRAFLGGLVVVYLGVVGLLAARVPSARGGITLEGWDETYEIRVADEVGGGRAYRGEIREARICAGHPPDPVCVSDGATTAARRELVRVAEATQRLRLEARLRSGSSRQFGPTRIVTFSTSPDLRNATLGQSGDDLVLRLRTPVGGENGTRVHFRLTDAIPAGEPVAVSARYRDGSVELTARTAATRQSAEMRPSRAWMLAWLVAGKIRPGHRMQLFWAGLAGTLVLLLPVGLAAGWWGGRRRTVLPHLVGAGGSALLFTVFSGALSGVAFLGVVGAGAVGAVGAAAGRRDSRVWCGRHKTGGQVGIEAGRMAEDGWKQGS